MPITEFKIPFQSASHRSRERNARLMAWGLVGVMSGLALFAACQARYAQPGLVRAATWITILIVVAAVVGAHFLSARLSLQRFEQSLVFVLTDTDLTRKRQGWPEVRIGLSEITALYKNPRFLLVEGGSPTQRIAIPEEVQGLDVLEAELAKHCKIAPAQKNSTVGLILFITSLFCWGLVIWSKDAAVIMTAGILAIILLTWEAFNLSKKMHHDAKRPAFLFLIIALGWLTAAILIYIRFNGAS